MDHLSTVMRQISRLICNLDPAEWAVVAVVVVGIGVLCMRGYGSRDTY